MGGYRQGVGPDGEGGFPGSTSATRYFKGASPRAAELHLRLDWEVTDTGQTFRVLLRNGVLTYSTAYQGDLAPLVLRGPRPAFAAMAATGAPVDGIETEGDLRRFENVRHELAEFRLRFTAPLAPGHG